MSQKISEMTHLSLVPNAAMLPFITAAAPPNYYCTKIELLFAAGGEGVQFTATNGAAIGIDSSGNPFCNVPALSTFRIDHPSAAHIGIDVTGNVQIQGGGTAQVQIAYQPASQYVIGSATTLVAQLLCAGSQSVFITFAATTPGNWVNPAPTDMAAAINRLAACVFFLNGAPIP